jgi:hypothetical protein
VDVVVESGTTVVDLADLHLLVPQDQVVMDHQTDMVVEEAVSVDLRKADMDLLQDMAVAATSMASVVSNAMVLVDMRIGTQSGFVIDDIIISMVGMVQYTLR